MNRFLIQVGATSGQRVVTSPIATNMSAKQQQQNASASDKVNENSQKTEPKTTERTEEPSSVPTTSSAGASASVSAECVTVQKGASDDEEHAAKLQKVRKLVSELIGEDNLQYINLESYIQKPVKIVSPVKGNHSFISLKNFPGDRICRFL